MPENERFQRWGKVKPAIEVEGSGIPQAGGPEGRRMQVRYATGATSLEPESPTADERVATATIPYGTISGDLGGYTEAFQAGAFSASVQRDDVRALVANQPHLILGRRLSGTLRLVDADAGVLVECDLPDTSYARDLTVSMERGDARELTIGYITEKFQWAKDPISGSRLRIVEQARLVFVGFNGFAGFDTARIQAERKVSAQVAAARAAGFREGHEAGRDAERRFMQAKAETPEQAYRRLDKEFAVLKDARWAKGAVLLEAWQARERARASIDGKRCRTEG